MSAPGTATRWAWDTLLRRFPGGHGIQIPHQLTLLAAADLLDRAVARAGGSMFHHDVLDQTVVGFDAADLVNHIGVTDRTAIQYCRALAEQGLLEARDTGRHFTLPKSAWRAATHPE